MTPGIDCDFTLAHPSVGAGAAVGFFLARQRGRKAFATRRARAGTPAPVATGGVAYADFGPGARKWKLLVTFEPHAVDARQAAAGGGTLAQLQAFYALESAVLTLRTPAGDTHQVRFLALDELAHPPEPGTTAELTLVEAI